MTRIIFIHQSADLYGSDKTLLLLLERLDRTAYEPIVVLPVYGPLVDELSRLGIRTEIAPVLKLYRDIFTPKNFLKFLSEIRESFKVLKEINAERKPDIVYSNTLAVLLGMFYTLSRRDIKHIWHVHEIIKSPKWAAYLFPKFLSTADVVVCNSEATRHNIVSRRPSLAKKTKVIHNGLAVPESQDYTTSKPAFGFNEQDFVITLVGRIYRIKGHFFAVSALAPLIEKHPNVKILFVGSPVVGQEDYLSRLETTISEAGLGKNIFILPFQKNLSEVWRATDLAIMPSVEAESFGLVALEAMLCKLPVVAANQGGLLEVVEHDKTGLLFEAKNENAFRDAVEQMLASPSKRHEFGLNGYNRALSEFSDSSYVASFQKLFSSVNGLP